MRRIFTGLAACLVAASLAGCGTASASSQPGQTPTASHPGASASCLRALTITNADNGKTHCVKVGTRVDVYLRGTEADMWQEPSASGHVLVGAPNGALSLALPNGTYVLHIEGGSADRFAYDRAVRTELLFRSGPSGCVGDESAFDLFD